MGCAEADSHVPESRIELSVSALRSLGARVQVDVFPGAEHKIFGRSMDRVRVLFNAELAKISGVRSARDPFPYLTGYMGYLESEALPEAVPRNQKSPHTVPYGLYAESISGSPMCAPRASNLTAWLYRIHPSIGTHGAFKRYEKPSLIRADFCCPGNQLTPEPLRWKPTEIPGEEHDFVDGIETIAGTGNPMSLKGMAVHRYTCNISMSDRAFYNSDGDLLIVPEKGSLTLQTEFGFLRVDPGDIFILPRGLKVTVAVEEPSRGFIAELFEPQHFQLPNLGPIGSNGLADARHFKVPIAAFEDRACKNYQLIAKFGGSLFEASLQYSPYDVVGWSGRYHPCKYSLYQFMSMGSVTWDHPDPSLHTVLTAPIDNHSGASACDLVCFRSRFDAVRHTFRPPWYHRNLASEFNAIIEIPSPYSGFDKGVHWLTPCMTAHGISGDSYNSFMARSPASDDAVRISEGALWIMFETAYPLILTDSAATATSRDVPYPRNFFPGVPRRFNGRLNPQVEPDEKEEEGPNAKKAKT
jgi:homogentisate 1,2-dioxygenase